MTGLLDLEGNVVIVTGGTMGAGKGIALRFLEAGADVTICARNAPSEPVTVGDREAHFVRANVRDNDDIERL
ncbi:MAG: SDR family NAD(P)-dependent oxidoreductase, partial [Polyangiales bacterium]